MNDSGQILSGCRIGVDVGGTFTDLVLSNPQTNELIYFKEPSTPTEPSEAVERGIAGILQRAELEPESVELLVHGTTIGINAIIQRRGARLALVVSKGNGDVMEIGRGKLPDSFNYRSVKEESLIPRDLVFEVSARTRANGSIEQEMSDEDIENLVSKLEAAQVSAVAIMFLNSFRYPQQERRLAQILRIRLPSVLVSESAQVWPEIREYERALVASLNAYIHPLMNSYFDRLQSRLKGIKVDAPIYVTTNNGGTVGIHTARQRPIDTVLSGPSAGVVAGARLARFNDSHKLITFDMGGTSSDMAISVKADPEYTTQTVIGEFPLILPVVNVSAIGAGGGSIIWVDPQGVLKVGPLSAGAEPGPICYGRGGKKLTVTDCYLALGILRSDGFLGGRMPLDHDSAMAALVELGHRIGFDETDGPYHLAESALRIATAKMATELFKSFAQRGLDPREFTLMSYGGAGPTHANLLAEEVGLKSIFIAPSPGTLCALGAIVTDLKRDYVRTIGIVIHGADSSAEALIEAADELKAEADLWIAEEGDIVGPIKMNWSADLKYVGEGQETNILLDTELLANRDLVGICALFHAEHEKLFGFMTPAGAIEFVNLRLNVTGAVPSIHFPELSYPGGKVRPEKQRSVFHGNSWISTDVYQRNNLKRGELIFGPALVEQEDTTVWILPGWRGAVTAQGVIHITKLKS